MKDPFAYITEGLFDLSSSGGYDDIIQRAATAHGIPDKVPIIQKMLQAESSGDRKAVSPKGARGLMQLMPGTARAMGVRDPEDPEQNIFGGVRYLKEMYDKFGGDDTLALAAYNAGPGAVKRAGGVPKFKETQNYVNKILSPLTGTMGGGFNDPRGDRLHYGGDISAEAGTSFIAPTRLKITNVREKMSNSPGGMVWGTDPATGLQFKFHHVIPGVKAGDMVEAGTHLGSLSSINGPHLDMKVYDPKKGEYIDWIASNKLKRGDKFIQGQGLPGSINPDASSMVADVTGQTVPAGVQNQQPPEKRAKISEILSGLAASMGPTAAEAAPPPDKSLGDKIIQQEMDPFAHITADIKDPFASITEGLGDKKPEDLSMGQKIARVASPYVRPVLEYGGMTGGGIIGSGISPIAGTVTGMSGGYTIGKQGADAFDQYAGLQKPPSNIQETAVKFGKDVLSGVDNAITAMVGGKVFEKGLHFLGQVGKGVMGRLSGVGTKSIEQAIEGNPEFTKALRGEISPDDVVNNARDALNIIKDKRSAAYLGKLAEVSQNTSQLDVQPIRDKLFDLMQKYNVKVNPNGTLDFSRIAMGKAGRRDIKSIVETIESWGSKPGDNTPVGLDVLKRQLDDFYSDSSQARAFVTNLRNEVKTVITSNVPEYAEMTKGYAEATKLIKDIESNLMMRKQGISGRITADQTLRRLTSAMRDNFVLRGELVEALGNESGKDIVSQIGGTAMSNYLPSGLGGSGPAIAAEMVLATFNPKALALIAASSPRIQGEFLRMYGKALKESVGMAPVVGQGITYKTKSMMDK